MQPRKSKCIAYLRDAHLKRWYANLARGSPISAEGGLRRLGRLCELLDTTPQKMVESAKRNVSKFQDSIEDLVSDLEAEGKSPGYIVDLVKTLKSWLRYNDLTLTRKIKVSNSTATPTIENERVPSQDELARVFRASPSRVKIAVALIAFADLRPQTIGNHNGGDGLTLKDLPEVRIENSEVKFEKIPTIIAVRATLSKAKHKYFTFLSSEGCTYLKEYLDQRLRSGEKLVPETPLIGHERPRKTTKQFLLTRKVTHLIRMCMRKAGVRKRPYVLRAYAETQLIIAESKGKISHPYLQFIAGHKGDIEARYSTNKGILPPDMIEDMRKCYKNCEPLLDTTVRQVEQGDIVKEAKIEALKSIAKTMFGIDLMEIKIAKEKESGKQLNPDEEIELLENEIKKLREHQDPQTIVAEEELEKHLAEGWEFVSVLPSKKILIRKDS